MARPFRMEVVLGNTRHVLNRAASEILLDRLDAFGEQCGVSCKRLREDLRRALEMTEQQAGGIATVVSEVTTVALEPLSDDAPLCWFCDSPGEVTEDGKAVCRNPACVRCGLPADLKFFQEGAR